jgi:vancomycin resistance protein YoaR
MGFLTLAVMVLIWGGLYFYTQYLQTIPGGVSLSGVDFSGLRRPEATLMVEKLADEWEKKTLKVVVSENGTNPKSKEVTLSELGLSFRLDQTLSKLFNGSEVAQADVLDVHASAGQKVVLPSLNIDERKWEEVLEWVKSFERPVRNAEIVFDETTRTWILHESQEGLALLESDERLLRDQFLLVVQNGLNDPLEAVLERIEASIKTEDVKSLFDRAQNLLERTYQWKVDGETVGFSFAENPEVLSVDLEKRTVEIDQDFLHAFLSEWSKNFNRSAGTVAAAEPILQEKGYLKSEYQGEFLSGRSLDEDQLLQQVLASDFSEEILELPFLSTAPEVHLEGEGNLSLISQGRSSYVLAHGEDREFNVRFGLSKYDGVVIPKGAEFNFNQVLGWVTYDAGWKPALAIFGGGGVKPVPGGGLCQVSTTMYRAVINSGLPVTARKPHSLDVSYYQQYGYGIDSTVYPPEDINLKFVNDTPGSILIHTWLDEVNKEVFTEFYGTDDGREVEIKQVTNRTVVLPNQVTYTSDIPTGLQEVLQNGRVGRYIEWEWNITRADGTVEKRAIETLYPAAAKIVRVGNG